MKRREKKHDRRRIEKRFRSIQVAMIDRVARKYRFHVTETGKFEFTVHARNTKSMETLAELSREVKGGNDLGIGAIVLAAYGMCLYDEKYERRTLNTENTIREVGEAIEMAPDRFSIKFTHKPATDVIRKVAAARKSTHADAIAVLMQGAAATLELHKKPTPTTANAIH